MNVMDGCNVGQETNGIQSLFPVSLNGRVYILTPDLFSDQTTERHVVQLI
jgi:hypothetical protein